MLLQGVADLVVTEPQCLRCDLLIVAAARHRIGEDLPLIAVDRCAKVADGPEGRRGGSRGGGGGCRCGRRALLLPWAVGGLPGACERVEAQRVDGPCRIGPAIDSTFDYVPKLANIA